MRTGRHMITWPVMATPVRDFLIFLVVTATTAGTARGDDEAGIEFCETSVRPLLGARCYECHSAAAGKLKGELSIDSREAVRKGGRTGAAVVPGKPEASLLIRAVRRTDDELQMPPKEAL